MTEVLSPGLWPSSEVLSMGHVCGLGASSKLMGIRGPHQWTGHPALALALRVRKGGRLQPDCGVDAVVAKGVGSTLCVTGGMRARPTVLVTLSCMC